VIEVRDLSITLGEFALHEISMLVPEGEYFVVLGPTGAGKTVLLECIVGLHQPAAGAVHLDGRDVTGLRPEERHVSYVPQDYCLFPHMTARDNITFGMRLRRWAPSRMAEKTRHLSELLHITPLLARRPLTLSGGEKQRVALARALAVEPRVLLLDEPLAAVDERTRERLCDELKTVQRELGTTTIHVSHNFEETLAVADRVGIFDRGRIMQVGTPHEVFHQPANRFVAEFTRAENLVPGVVVRERDAAHFVTAGLRLPVTTDRTGPARLVVRPEELHLQAPGAPVGPDCLTGQVARTVDKGPLVRVLVRAGDLDWSVLVASRAAQELRLAAGAAVVLQVPSAAVHLLPAEAASLGDAEPEADSQAQP